MDKQVPVPEDKYSNRATIQWPISDELVILHLNVLHALTVRNWQLAFNHQTNLCFYSL